MTRFDLSTGADGDLHVYGPPPLKRITEGLWSREQGVLWLDVIARMRHPKSVREYHRRGGTGRRAEPVVHVEEMEGGQTIEGRHWQCHTYLVDHAQPYLASIGFRFETDEGVVAFGGDAEPNERLVALGQDVDMFVLNALGSVERAARVAEEAAAKRLTLAHLHHSLTTPALVNGAIKQARNLFGGSVYWGNDMTMISWGEIDARVHHD
jgi:ribonuclease BN (tRNA processing enzyme)